MTTIMRRFVVVPKMKRAHNIDDVITACSWLNGVLESLQDNISSDAYVVVIVGTCVFSFIDVDLIKC